MLRDILGTKSAVSLRQISQNIHRFGLVLASLPDSNRGFLHATVTALILRTMDEGLYDRFRTGKATDLEVIDTIFPDGQDGIVLEKLDSRRLFEIAIILGYEALSGRSSPLLQKYRDLEASGEPDDDASREYRKHVGAVIDQLDVVRRYYFRVAGAGFEFAIHRIELFSNELKGDTVSNTNSSG